MRIDRVYVPRLQATFCATDVQRAVLTAVIRLRYDEPTTEQAAAVAALFMRTY